MPFLLIPIPKITNISFVVFRSARHFHPLNKCCVYSIFFYFLQGSLLPLWTQRNASFLWLIVYEWVGFNRCICFDEKLLFSVLWIHRRMTYLFIGFFVNTLHTLADTWCWIPNALLRIFINLVQKFLILILTLGSCSREQIIPFSRGKTTIQVLSTRLKTLPKRRQSSIPCNTCLTVWI